MEFLQEENRCGFYMFQDKYEHYLETKGYLEHCRTNVDMDGVHEVEAIEQVREGLHDLKEEMRKMKLQIEDLKNEERKTKCACVVLIVLLLVVGFALK